MNPNQTLVAVCNAFKKLTFTLFFLFACSAFAQVGVGTQNPQATLHVAGANANANGTAPGALAAGDGVIVTRVTDDLSGENITTGCSAATRGALVYSTNDSGYYTCNGTNWVALGGAAARTVTVTADANYAILLTDDIIEYTGTAAGNWTFPAGAAIGKTFTVAATSSGQVSLLTATTGSNTLSPGAGTQYIHLGGDRYAALHSF